MHADDDHELDHDDEYDVNDGCAVDHDVHDGSAEFVHDFDGSAVIVHDFDRSAEFVYDSADYGDDCAAHHWVHPSNLIHAAGDRS